MGEKTPEITAPQKTKPIDELKEFKKDMENIGEEKNQIPIGKFLAKHQELLADDINAFTSFLEKTDKIEPVHFSFIRQCAEIHIHKDPFNKNTLKLFHGLSNILMNFSEKDIKKIYKTKSFRKKSKTLHIGTPSFDFERPEYPVEEAKRLKGAADQMVADVVIKKDLRLSNSELKSLSEELRKDPKLGKILLEFKIIESLFERMIERIQNDPHALIRAIEITEKLRPEALPSLMGKIKRYKINDEQFLKILSDINKMEYSTARTVAITILSTPTDKPFENIANFKQIAKEAIKGFSIHKDVFLIKTILERGYVFLKEDEQTKNEIMGKISELETGAKEEISKWLEWRGSPEVQSKEKKKKEKGKKEAKRKEPEKQIEKEKEEWEEIAEVFSPHIEEIKRLMEKGKFREALVKIADALQIDQGHTELQELTAYCISSIIEKGEDMQSEEKYDEALSHFNLVLKYFPRYPDAISGCMFCNFLKSQRGMEDLEGPPRPNMPKKAEISEEDMEKVSEQVKDYLSEGEYETAKWLLTELDKKHPDNPAVIHALAICSITIGQMKQMEALRQLSDLDGMEAGEEKLKKVIGILPYLTQCLQGVKEYFGYQRYLLDKNIGDELVDKTQMFMVLTDTLKISKSGIQEYMKKINKLMQKEPIPLSEDERRICAEFFRAEADLLAFYNPERKCSFWDLYTVDIDENKTHVVEGKEGMPVKIDTLARIEIDYEDLNVIRRINSLRSLSKDKEFRESADIFLGALHRYKENGNFPKNSEKAFLSFKKNLTRILLEGEGDEKFKRMGRNLLKLMEYKEILLDLVVRKSKERKKSDLPKKQWGDESIDPAIELALNSMALDSYLNAIRLDPGNIKNYEALFGFIRKIGLMPEFSDELGIKQELEKTAKELKKDPEKASRKIFDRILSKIDRTKSLYAKEEKEKPEEKNLTEMLNLPDDLIISFGPLSPERQTDKASGIDSSNSNLTNPFSGAMMNITLDIDAVLDAISRKFKKG